MGEAMRETATTVNDLKALDRSPASGGAARTVAEQAADDAAKRAAAAKIVPVRREEMSGFLAG